MINEQGMYVDEAEEEAKESKKFWLKYISVPIEIFINQNLTEKEKLLWGIIHCLDGPKGCFATNQFLGLMMQTSPTTISVAVSNLIKENLIHSTTNPLGKRILKINKGYTTEQEKNVQDFENMLNEKLKGGVKENLKGGLSKLNAKNTEEEDRRKEDISKEMSSGLTTTQGISKRDLLSQKAAKLAEQNRTRKDQEVNTSLVAIIDKWNSLESLPHHNAGTKTYARITSNLESLFAGTFFNKIPEFAKYKGRRFNRPEIIEAMRRHHLAATSADYMPLNKTHLQSIRLDVFWYNSYGKTEDSMSWFLHWLEHEPVLVNEKRNESILSKDANPDITNMLINWYSDVVMKGNNGHYTPQQVMDFVSASKRIKTYSEKIKINNEGYWVQMHDCKNKPELIAKLTMEMLEEYINKNAKKVPTFFLASENTYTQFLPDYLKSTAYI